MALATTCPRCQTAFRVVPDQLKIRRGLVRCGNCRHVFSGLDSLRYVGDAGVPAAGSDAATGANPPPVSAPTASARQSAGLQSPGPLAPSPQPPQPDRPLPADFDAPLEGPETLMIVDTMATAERLEGLSATAEPIVPRESVSQHRSRPSTIDDVELEGLDTIDLHDDRSYASPDLPDPSADTRDRSTPADPAEPVDPGDPVDSALSATDAAPSAIAPTPSAAGRVESIDDHPEAWSAAVLAPGAADRRDDGGPAEAVDFFAPPSRAGGFVSRANAVAALASVVLGLTLLLQLGVAARDWLGATVPGFEAVLSAIGSSTGISIEAPRALAAITLESFDVHAGAAPDALVMNALLRNRADHRVRWPSMELSLTDAGGALIVRKVIGPDDYLPAGQARAGAPASRELPLQVALETVGIQPAGYNVQLFYP